MKLYADLTKRVVVNTSKLQWISSPTQGVLRRMLDRDGDEVARATTIVKFVENSSFPKHTHGGGEEFFVLEGVFSDENGDYGEGYYVRHPIDSSHTPFSKTGCVILVKLRQMTDKTEKTLIVDTLSKSDTHSEFRRNKLTQTGNWEKVSENHFRMKLFESLKTGERVFLERWEKGFKYSPQKMVGGEEMLVLEGDFEEKIGDDVYKYEKGTWIRNPSTFVSKERFTKNGCKLWVKTGHLP
jgi:anti-sigma factor ChrR (cupin superfamily)